MAHGGVSVQTVPLKPPKRSLLLRKSGRKRRFEGTYADLTASEQERVPVRHSLGAKRPTGIPRMCGGNADPGLCLARLWMAM